MKYKPQTAKLPAWEDAAKKGTSYGKNLPGGNNLPVYDPTQLMKQYQGAHGKAQGFWGNYAPMFRPMNTRKGV